MVKDSLFQEAIQELSSLRDVLRWGTSRFSEAQLFYGHGTDNAWDEAVSIALHVLHLRPPGDKQLLAARLTLRERQAIIHLFERRISERIPAAYLIKSAWFAGMEFYLDQRVLIPRSPLAELIEQHFAPWLDQQGLDNILEIGTGSGCIACACADAFPEVMLTATDISHDALEVARINLKTHGLTERVQLLQGDLFAPLKQGQRFDVIISNPPYADASDLAILPAEYHHEPVGALAGGQDGLDIVKRILACAGDYLNPQGILIVEVGNSEAALEEQFPKVPFNWLEFQCGGQGVFLLTAPQVQEHRDTFRQACQAIK